MATFLTDMMKKRYTQEEVFDVLFESEQDRKRRRMHAIVTETVDAHRLRQMRELLAFEKLATFRRMNGFDRDGIVNMIGVRFHRRLKNSMRVCGQICKS